MTVLELYKYAEGRQIDVDWIPLHRAESLSVLLEDGACAVAIDPGRLRGQADERVKLAHELGHCETGAFYSQWAPLDERGRCEQRANRWAIQRLLPYEALARAMGEGSRDVPALAEYFGVTEDFVREALRYYTEVRGLTFQSHRAPPK